MKHAGSSALETIEPLLVQLRAISEITEKKPGIFYRKGKAFLHFHEDPLGVFADARLDGVEFERFAVNSSKEEAKLLALVKRTVSL